MICENGYKLKLTTGEVKTFDTDLELDAYIDEQMRLHPNAVSIEDFVTRAVDFQKIQSIYLTRSLQRSRQYLD